MNLLKTHFYLGDLLQSIITVILLLLFVKVMATSESTFKCSNKTKVIASILTVNLIIYILPYYDPSIYPAVPNIFLWLKNSSMN